MQIRKFNRSGITAALAAAGMAAAAHATPLFVDTFNYPAGALVGSGPPAASPAGQGGWTSLSGNPQVTVGGLSDGVNQSIGNKATVAGLGARIGDGATAGIAQVGGSAGGVVWVGFLINQATGAAAPGGFAVVSVGTSSTNLGIGVLFDQNVYGIDNNLSSPVERAQTTVPCNGTVVRLVTKLDFAAGMEYIFVDPPSGNEPSNAAASASQAMTADFRAAGIDQATVVAGGNAASFNVGELRVGTAFADVLPDSASSQLPTVTLAATVRQVIAGSGGKGDFTLSRTGGDLSTDLVVAYSVKGSARPGVDYQLLSGSKKLKAGKGSTLIKVKPLGDLGGASKAVVTLNLLPDSHYLVGTSKPSKVKILNGP